MSQPEMKPAFEERMKTLIPDRTDFEQYKRIIHTPPRNFIRVNTLKISIEELIKKLSKKWKISQPYPENPEIILIENDLLPGELGNAIEHILGYYYIQEISSMLPPITLNPKKNEFILDLCASPGSKTTQIAKYMENQGTIIANDVKIDRIKILGSNMERMGATNIVVTRKDAIALCASFAKNKIKFDKILVDAPCSGEGTLRSSTRTFRMWNPKVIKKFSRQQKKFVAFALKCLKKNGDLVYSTCTHSPEENEEVVDFMLQNFPVEIEQTKNRLPLKSRDGITEWKNKKFHKNVKNTCRIYPQDNDSEGFFVSKVKLMEEIE